MSSDWYRDEASVLSVIRESTGGSRPAPVIGGYDDLQELRRGGQGIIYTATQASTKRKVAIKVLLGGAFASERDRLRFEREIDLAASLRHSSIVRLYDCGVTAERYPYFVMEFIEGIALDELLVGGSQRETQRPFGAIRPTVEMFVKVCDGVSYAHRHAVIHRDLKPSNIRIDAAGEPHVLDFGLARSSTGTYNTDDSDVRVSLTGEFMGSLPWASPEQAEGNPSRIDVRTDVYALGVVLYQLLTGRFPYSVSGSFRDVLDNIMHAEPLSPRQARPEIDDELSTIVLKCLEKDQERRYQTAGDLARDLRNYLAGEPIEAKRDSAWYAIRKRLRRYRIATRVAVAFVVLSLSFSIVLSVLWQRAVRAEDQANAARTAETAARTQAERDAETAASVNQILRDILVTPVERGREARVVDVLEPALQEINQRDDLDPAMESSVRDTIGTAFASLGMYEKAEPLLDRALQLAIGTYGEDKDETLLIRSHVAWLKYLEGDYDESAAIYQRTLDDRMRLFGEDDPQTAVCMNDLALALEALDRLDEAEQMHRDAYELTCRLEGERSRDAINSIGNLASILHTKGELDEAEALMRKRLKLSREVFGDDDPDTWTAMNNLGVLLDDLAKPDEAMKLLTFVHDHRAQQLGENNIDTLRVEQNLAFVYSSTGRFEEAEAALRHSSDAMQQQYGADHPLAITMRANLASVLNRLGRLDEAEAIEREVLESSRRVYGETHLHTRQAANNLAATLLQREKFDEAVALLGPLVKVMEQTMGPDNFSTLMTKANYAAGLRETGKVAEAEQVAREVLDARRRVLGPDHPGTLQAEFEIVGDYLDSGRVDQAITAMEALMAHAAKALPADDWYLPIMEGYYGKCLLVAGRYEEAEKHLLAARDKLEKMVGPDHFVTQAQLGRLNWLYEEWGKPKLAASYYDLLDSRQRAKQKRERRKYAKLSANRAGNDTPD